MPMRLMHVYMGISYGGIERLIMTTFRLRGLWSTVDPSFVICPPHGEFGGELERAGAKVHYLRMNNPRLRNPISLWRARRALRELLARERVEMVAVHNLWLWAIFGPGARAAGLPSVLWLHDPPMKANGWLTRYARLTPPDMVLSHSLYTARLVPELYPGVPVEAVYCPVEPDPALSDRISLARLRAAARAELGVDEDGVVVIQNCRPSALKGNLELVRALAKLRDLPNWLCLQVGRPVLPDQVEYLERVKRAVNDLGIADRVRFLGYRSDLARLLAASDVHCQPNPMREPFGIAFVEALYAGLPVLTTALAGPLEIVDDSCGMLVPPGDVDALAAALATLIGDRELRLRLGANGPARARQLCDPPAQMAKLEAALLRARERVPAGEVRA